MNNVIATIDQRDFDSSVSIDDRNNYYQRRAARAVLSDDSGQVALMYVASQDYYKLPGGGVERDEDIEKALARELLEETGFTAIVNAEVGSVVEWRDFAKLHQISYAFTASIVGEPGLTNLDEFEIEQGLELRWAEDIDQAIEWVEATCDHDDLGARFMSIRDTAILKACKEQLQEHKGNLPV